MSTGAPPVIQVLYKALILADNSGAPEIGIDHLLGAVNDECFTSPEEPLTETCEPVPKQELPLSLNAVAALSFLGEINEDGLQSLLLVSVDDLRRALLKAKRDEPGGSNPSPTPSS